MIQSRNRTAPPRSAPRTSSADRFSVLTDFYREEFLKHQACLQRQREYYSEGVITPVEQALNRILSRLEKLSATKDADQVVSRLLRKVNLVTGLSGWTDPKNVH